MRQGVDLNALRLSTHMSKREFEATFRMALRHEHHFDRLLDLSSLAPDAPVNAIPASIVAKQLIFSSNYSNRLLMRVFAVVITVVHSLLPYAVRLIIGDPAFGGTDWSDYVIAVCITLVAAFCMYSNASFLFVGIFDFRRRHLTMTALYDLLMGGYEPPVESAAEVRAYENDARARRQTKKEAKSAVAVAPESFSANVEATASSLELGSSTAVPLSSAGSSLGASTASLGGELGIAIRRSLSPTV